MFLKISQLSLSFGVLFKFHAHTFTCLTFSVRKRSENKATSVDGANDSWRNGRERRGRRRRMIDWANQKSVSFDEFERWNEWFVQVQAKWRVITVWQKPKRKTQLDAFLLLLPLLSLLARISRRSRNRSAETRAKNDPRCCCLNRQRTTIAFL